MRDGILLAERGVPVVALITERFWGQGEFLATALGMPDVPRLQLPHPLAGATPATMEKAAEAAVPDLIAMLEGRR